MLRGKIELLDDSEKAFWISYSDLMTALMVLFLILTVSAFAAFSEQTLRAQELRTTISEQEREIQNQEQEIQIHAENTALNESLKASLEKVIEKGSTVDLEKIKRQQEIKTLCYSIRQRAENAGALFSVDCNRFLVDLGSEGRFATDSYKLGDKALLALNAFVPAMLEVAQSELGKKWLKRVHVQGFTDPDGSYLYNLSLSLKRSEWVLCQILSDEPNSNATLSTADKSLVKQIFLVSGVSYTDQKQDKDDSRRIEFKLEFYELDEPKQTVASNTPIENTKEVCQI